MKVRKHSKMNWQIKQRRGLLFLELLIVMTIIFALVALLLPMIQRARSAARRVNCKNNLKQIALGLHNYQDTYSVFSPGVVDSDHPVRSEQDGFHIGWIVQLLPYLEQQALHDLFDADKSVYDPVNKQFREQHIGSLLCPAFQYSDGNQIAGSNYAGSQHHVESAIDVDNHGIFFLNRSLKIEDILDGTTQTLFVGEKLLPAGDLGWASGTRATLRNAGHPLNSVIPQAQQNQPRPNQKITLYVGGFNSMHGDGVHFAFGDGSVRMLPNTINSKILQQLADRADGEMTGNFRGGEF